MIRIILQGGLGNQMFEYATAKVLAAEIGGELVLDMSFFETHKNKVWNRPYELDVFAINERQVSSLWGKALVQLLPRIRARMIKKGRGNHIGRYWFDTNGEVRLSARENATLFGYFVNAHRLEAHREMLLGCFQFKKELNVENAEVANRIAETNAISVHIRRGDYLNATNASLFAQQSVEWYQDAIASMCEQLENPTFYFFSDDIAWAKQEFADLSNAIFVDVNHTAETAHCDMRLMSLCKHNIITNSTFSWWGAWLNTHPDKIVMSPKQYYRDDEANEKLIARLIPTDWVIL